MVGMEKIVYNPLETRNDGDSHCRHSSSLTCGHSLSLYHAVLVDTFWRILMTRSSLSLSALLAALSLFAAAPLKAQTAAAPTLINYQGRLATPSSNPVPDGTYSIRFSLWDAITTGTEKWNQTIANVPANRNRLFRSCRDRPHCQRRLPPGKSLYEDAGPARHALH